MCIRDSRVAIQGVGQVGFGLAKLLKEAGAQLWAVSYTHLDVYKRQ